MQEAGYLYNIDVEKHEQTPPSPMKTSKSPKKAKSEDEANGGKSIGDVAMEFDKFCKATIEYLSIEQMREILEANNLDASGSDDAVVPRCQDILFYGPLDECPICGGTLEWTGTKYYCKGDYNDKESASEPRNNAQRRMQDPQTSHLQECNTGNQRLKDMEGKFQILYNLSVTTPAERERGGSTKIADALERGIQIVSEDWLIDSIEKMEAQPLEDYDISRDLVVEAKAILGDKDDQAEVKVYGKRGVHKDTKLYERGRQIFEKDEILYNCTFSLCDLGRGVNDFCVMQLIMVPNAGLHLYSKKRRHVRKTQAEERLEEWENTDAAIKEFAKLFEELTGNEFEPWEREKFQKKRRKFYPIDMDDGVDVRHGGLGFRQKAAAVIHCKLNPIVANFMKILCSQEIYRYALTELALDTPDIPMAMLSEVHLKRCETVLLQFIAAVKTMKETRLKARAAWDDFSMKWFTLLHSTRPFFFHDYQDLVDHAAAGFETIRDITVASHLIGDMSGPTIDDPLFDRYEKLGCSISPVEKKSDDYKMIVDYLEETYEPVKIGNISYGVSVENIVEVEPSACPSYDEIKRLPNKVLLWCGTRSSNVLRHLQKGFLPSISWLPLPGYMFGKAIICTDAAAEAARYGFTAADRPEGFLVLAIASLGDQITEYNRTPEAEEAKILEENKVAVKGLGRKKTDESEHFVWKDDIKVPRGRLVKTEHKDSPLEYNEYAVYDSKAGEHEVCGGSEV
ncbi:poly ADP-ribose polymerase 3 [Actinidia rufa]|uniref:Poly [ADP-ribose] polymerase n=1 Tax=Actinidia rufa TaxID=165716 RepID=A0A7J0HB45_9ERIC|nr:poly ADP-ribose polymerase 3 [Actinidia rufa]